MTHALIAQLGLKLAERDAQIAALKQQVERLQTRELKLSQEVGSLWLDLDAAREQVQSLERERDEAIAALRALMDAVTPELTGPPKNVPKSSWGAQWDAAEAVLDRHPQPGQQEGNDA